MGLLDLLAGHSPVPPQPSQGALMDSFFAPFTSQQPQGLFQPPQAQAQVSPAQSAQAPSAPVSGAPITVTGDSWQPKSPGWLGQALDAMLMLKGKQPVFQNRKAQESLSEVMPGYNSDPLQTIHRIAEIPGMANKAAELYQQYQTDQERQGSRDIRDSAKKDLITQRLGGIAGVTNEKNFDKAHQLMVDYVKRWGEDPKDYDIPDSYDRDALDLMSGGSITAKDQQAEQARQTALDIRQQQANSLDTYRESRLNQMQQGLNDQMTRFNHNLTMREDEFKKTHSGGGMVTDQGVPIVVDPTGSKAFVLRNGVKYGYIKGGSQDGKINWVPVGPLQAQK